MKTHIDTNEPQAPWTDRSRFYVSVIDGERWNVLLGPFAAHEQALQLVEPVRKVATDLDPRAHWYSFGTCQTEDGYVNGMLNDRFIDAPIVPLNRHEVAPLSSPAYD